MTKVLIISGHPDLDHSLASRTILEDLQDVPGLTIEQRRDEKAQMSHVPKRFWQDMCEMQPDLASPAGAAVRKAD